MKESEQYLAFIKRNLIVFLTPLILGLLVSSYLYSQAPAQVKVSQSFKINYEAVNADASLALTDQAVTELRTQGFEKLYPEAEVIIFKPGPLTLRIEAISLDRTTSFELLLKESEYLRQNFSSSELVAPEVSTIEPNLFKYLGSGLLLGFLVGLIASLLKEYFKNF